MTAIRFQCRFTNAGTQEMLNALCTDRFASRLFARDHTLWGPDAEAEAKVRLGWVDATLSAQAIINESEQLRAQLREESIDQVVLCGMGGSSLAPQVISQWAGVPLTVVDSTHPSLVFKALNGDLARTVVVVSSKSGTTIETRSHLAAFEAAMREQGVDAAQRIVVVTDPGSELEKHAREHDYKVFVADPNIGGRFSAFSAFGLVAPTLAGADLRPLITQANDVRTLLSADTPENPALQLAAALAAEISEKNILALVDAQHPANGLPVWVEQLVAESTGKQGVGLLPIALPAHAFELHHTLPSTLRMVLSDDSVNLSEHHFDLALEAQLGAQMLTWEVATAALGRLIGVDPFNQPDVEFAKVAARAALSTEPEKHTHEPEQRHTPAEVAEQLRKVVHSESYIALQVFCERNDELEPVFEELREALATHLSVPVALGWGPTYLHSTGQLHKGGAPTGVFVQFVDADMADLPIAGTQHTFGELISSQALGDARVLEERSRPVFRLVEASCASAARSIAEQVARQ